MNDTSIIKTKIVQELTSILQKHGTTKDTDERELELIYDKLSDLVFDIDSFLGEIE